MVIYGNETILGKKKDILLEGAKSDIGNVDFIELWQSLKDFEDYDLVVVRKTYDGTYWAYIIDNVDYIYDLIENDINEKN